MYVTVPSVISLGTVIESNNVEFSPGTVGSGEKDIDVNLKSEPPFEQSVRDAKDDDADRARAKRRGAHILFYVSKTEFRRSVFARPHKIYQNMVPIHPVHCKHVQIHT